MIKDKEASIQKDREVVEIIFDKPFFADREWPDIRRKDTNFKTDTDLYEEWKTL